VGGGGQREGSEEETRGQRIATPQGSSPTGMSATLA
jgi:hypothetical protein